MKKLIFTILVIFALILLSYIQEFLFFAKYYGTELGTLVSSLALVGGLVTFFIQRNDSLKIQEPESYHNFIKPLVEGECGVTYQDRQIAVLFGLKEYERHHSVSLHILKGSYQQWSNGDKKDKIERVLAEMERTIKFLEERVRAF